MLALPHIGYGPPMGELTKTPAPVWATWMDRFNRWASRDLGGGPRPFPLAWWINVQKVGTAPFVFALMVAYDNFSVAAWVYLALHGTYGLCWLLKHLIFPDPGWDEPVTLLGGVNSWLFVLGLYWVAPFLLISDVLGPDRFQPSLPLIAAAISLHTLGVVVMMAADTQKYFVLKVQRGLIEDGWFKRVRHTNYTGEMMLYSAYALLVGHWIPWVILFWVWGGLFLTNMLMKEQSLSRYPGWAAYKRRSGMLLPKIFAKSSTATHVEPQTH